MAKGFVKNANRVDPYKSFKFRVKWDGKTVLGVSKVSALKRTTEVVKHRDGGDNSTDHKSPGRTTYDAITMERGLTHDPEFEAWANKVHPYAGDAADGPGQLQEGADPRNDEREGARRFSAISCTTAGSASSRRCRNSMPTPTPWPSSR